MSLPLGIFLRAWHPSRTIRQGALVGALFLGAASLAQAQIPGDTLASAPLLSPQAEGVFYLPVNSAALVQWTGPQAKLVSRTASTLRWNGPNLVGWNGDYERPTWRVQIPSPGKYRVVITEQTPPGEEHTAAIEFAQAKKGTKTASKFIGASTTPGTHPFEMGEIALDAGEQTFSVRPVSWISPYAQGTLVDLRLIPLEPIQSRERGANDLMRQLGVDAGRPVAALLAKIGERRAEIEKWNAETRRRDFSEFKNFQQFLAFDRAPARLAEEQQELANLTRDLTAARIAQLREMPEAAGRLKPADAARLQEYLGAVTAAKQAETAKFAPPSVPPPASPAPSRTSLFPTGNFDELPRQPIDEKKPRVELKLTAPPDVEQRRAQFARRNEPAELAALCDQFARVLVPGSPGLAEFERLHAAGRPAEALAAYRAYFFAKLSDPESHGAATENILFELTRERGRRELLMRPSPLALEQNMAGAAVAEIGNQVVIGHIGMPGSVSWVPRDLPVPESAANDGRVGRDPWWQTDGGKEAKRTLEFFRYLHAFPGDRAEFYSGGFFPALLWSYAVSGQRAHLQRWCEYLDDFALHARCDLDDAPFAARNATELETQSIRATLNLLRLVQDERPELARDFDPATLARLLMHMVADHAPYLIRARRAEMANWGIMGLCQQLHVSRFLSEFRAEGYFNRECWRLWNANMIQHRTLDGENIEAWDQGHNFITQEYARYSFPFARWPAEVDGWDLTDLYDQLRVDQRGKLIHISPGGFYLPYKEAHYPRAWNTLQTYWRPAADGEAWNLIETEPGAMARLRTMMSGGHPADGKMPERFSDHAPYAAMSYLRDSWEPGADYFVLQNFRTRSQGQADCARTMYSLSKNDRELVEAHGLVVDGKPDNRYQGAVRTGGKTEYCAQASREVWPERFHTSERFDFAEGLQDAPYASHRYPYPDPWGLYTTRAAEPDPHPITDVTVLRQCFGLRAQGLWLVCDRIQSPAGHEHEYTQFFSLPLRIEEKGFPDRLRVLAAAGNPLVQVDEKESRVRTLNPGFENVSLSFFAPAPLQFGSGLDARRAPTSLPGTALSRLQARLAAGKLDARPSKQGLLEPVSVRWSGKGRQVFVTALTSTAAEDQPEAHPPFRAMEPLRGAGGVLGCHTITARGAEVWLASGPEAENLLQCGPVRARAETLLVAQMPGQPVAGLVLGCREFMGVKMAAGQAGDFEFELDRQGRMTKVTPIYRPIGSVRILPDRNVFMGSVDVSFALPEGSSQKVDLRYTTDGTEPTLDSPLYSAPLHLSKTTMVKVRAFRPGLKSTPWALTGTESGRTMSAIFRQQTPRPPSPSAAGSPGLRYQYLEGDWPTLFSYAALPGVLEPRSSGIATGLLKADEIAQIRHTDRAYALRYEGCITVPATGVYTFFAPEHLYTPTMDAGYDLRVFIDGEEWLPSPRLHAENTSSIALQAGPHRIQVTYVDYRWRKFRNEYWLTWLPEEMWNGIPVLEVEAPGLPRQPVPAAWLGH